MYHGIGSESTLEPIARIDGNFTYFKERVLREELFFPNEINGDVITVFAIMIIGFISVLLIESLAQKKKVVEVNP